MMSREVPLYMGNASGVELLHFFDYDKDNDRSHPDDGAMDDLMSNVSRKESRIPVPIRRLRPRLEERSNIIPPDERGSIIGDPGAMEEWKAHSAWTTPAAGLSEKDAEMKKIARLHRRKSAPAASQQMAISNMSAAVEPSTNNAQTMCPHCNRSYAMITKDGVYVAFSIGLMPLLLLVTFFVMLFLVPMVGSYCGRFRAPLPPPRPPQPPPVAIKPPPPPPPSPPRRKGWIGPFFINPKPPSRK